MATLNGPSSNGSSSGADNKQLPLQYAWTLWHTAPATGGGWSANYKQIASFTTVSEFWRLFNNISPPSLLDTGSSYHLFKGKVKPAWEDKFNANGGAWSFRFTASSKQKGGRDDRGRGGRGGRGLSMSFSMALSYFLSLCPSLTLSDSLGFSITLSRRTRRG